MTDRQQAYLDEVDRRGYLKGRDERRELALKYFDSERGANGAMYGHTPSTQPLMKRDGEIAVRVR